MPLDQYEQTPPKNPSDQPAAETETNARRISPQVTSGAHWFYWIAGLSLINTVLHASGSNISFVVGLGLTQVIDAVFVGYTGLGYLFDALLLGLFCLFGYFSAKGYLSAFIVGSLLYLVDAGIYVLVQDWFSVLFHAYAMFCIVRGAIELHQINKE